MPGRSSRPRWRRRLRAGWRRGLSARGRRPWTGRWWRGGVHRRRLRRAGCEAMLRAPGSCPGGSGNADEGVALVLDRGDGARGVAAQVPPVVVGDAVAVGVGSGADGRVAGRGLGVGVVVVAVGEVGALVEKEAESVAFEVGAVALEVVFAELVDDEDDDELGAGVVGAGWDVG